jgi:hypothetical protein
MSSMTVTAKAKKPSIAMKRTEVAKVRIPLRNRKSG